jgi:hypothetical protein
VLDRAGARLDAVRAELRLDDRVGLLRRCASRGVDEDRLAVARDREPVRLEVARELASPESRSPVSRLSRPVACSSSSTSMRMRQSSFAMSVRA